MHTGVNKMMTRYVPRVRHLISWRIYASHASILASAAIIISKPGVHMGPQVIDPIYKGIYTKIYSDTSHDHASQPPRPATRPDPRFIMASEVFSIPAQCDIREWFAGAGAELVEDAE